MRVGPRQRPVICGMVTSMKKTKLPLNTDTLRHLTDPKAVVGGGFCSATAPTTGCNTTTGCPKPP